MKPAKPATDRPPRAASAYDFLLDPLPLPEVQESDSDTAWARWEDMLKAESEPVEPEFPVFEETQPIGLRDLPGMRKP